MRKFILLFTVLWLGCNDNSNQRKPASRAVYIRPSINKYGVFKKGHLRMPVSVKANAIQSRNKSRYYYHSRGKYKKKK